MNINVCECGATVWQATPFGAAIVDRDDENILTMGWSVMLRGQARSVACLYRTACSRTIRLHRYLSQASALELIDHKNGNPLDNRHCNLRRALFTESNQNRRGARGYSGFKGVSMHRPGVWRASISSNGKRITIGHFSSAVAAALAYDDAARDLHGDYAKTNAQMGKLVATNLEHIVKDAS